MVEVFIVGMREEYSQGHLEEYRAERESSTLSMAWTGP